MGMGNFLKNKETQGNMYEFNCLPTDHFKPGFASRKHSFWILKGLGDRHLDKSQYSP